MLYALMFVPLLTYIHMLFFSESIEDRLDKICGSNTDLRELLQMKLMKMKQSN